MDIKWKESTSTGLPSGPTLIQDSLDNMPRLSIGKSLLILLSCEERDFNVALSKQHEYSDPIVQSLWSLHLSITSKPTSVHTIISSLFERASKSTQEDNTTPITRIVTWLYEKHDKLVANEFVIHLKSGDKRAKLGAVSILRTLIDTSLNVSNKQKKARKKEKTTKLISEIEDDAPAAGFKIPRVHNSMIFQLTSYRIFLAPLLQCIVNDSVKVSRDKCQATLLTVTAADCFSSLTYALAIASYNSTLENREDEEMLDTEEISKDELKKETEFIGNITKLSEFIQTLIMWYEEHRPLFATCLTTIRGILSNIQKVYASLTDDEDKENLERVLTVTWAMFSPYLMEENAFIKKNIYKELNSLLSMVQSAVRSKEDEPAVNEHNTRVLICIGLIVGKYKQNNVTKLMTVLEKSFLDTLMPLIAHSYQPIQDLAVNLIQVLIPSCPNIDTAGLLDNLMLMLEDAGDLNKAVVALVAQLLVTIPNKLGTLFLMLDGDSAAKRNHVLNILSEVFRVQKRIAFENKKINELIAHELLSRLADEELTSRVHAATLFSQLEPEFIIPKLIDMTTSANVKSRSAAEKALGHLLTGTSNPNAILVVLDCAKRASEPVKASPVDPNSLFTDNTPQAEQKVKYDIAERLFQLLAQWADKAAVSIWPDLIDKTLTRLFAMPSDSLTVKFISSLSLHFSNYPTVIFPLLQKRMESQPRVTEMTLTESDTFVLQNMIFDRLAPLLVLRTLSVKSFTDLAVRAPSLLGLLFDRVLADLEFDDVRKVSAEIIGKCPPSLTLPLIVQELQPRVMSLDSVKQTKALIYSTCHMLLLHSTSIEQSADFDALFELIQRPLTVPSSVNDTEVQKLQMGCIDCLGIVIKTALEAMARDQTPAKNNEPKRPLIEEISDVTLTRDALAQNDSSHFSVKLTTLVHVLTNPKQLLLNMEIDTQFKICIVNAFISSLKQLTASAVDKLMALTLGPVQRAFHASNNVPLKSSYLQFLFTLAYQAKDRVAFAVPELHALSLAACKDTAAEVRFGGLKLLGALFTADAGLAALFDNDTTVLHTRSALLAIAHADQSAQCRELAEKLVSIAFSQ